MTRVWELVDATDEEQYHTLGLFTSVERAREMACREEAPRYLPDAQELVRFEIRTRELDKFDHPGWETVEVWTWVEEFGESGSSWQRAVWERFDRSASDHFFEMFHNASTGRIDEGDSAK